MESIVITGMGGVSPIGIGNAAMDESLRQCKHGYKDISTFTSSEKYPLMSGASIGDFPADDYLSFPADAKYRGSVRPKRLDSASQYALVAAKLAAEQAGLLGEEDRLSDLNAEKSAVIMGIALMGVESYDRLHSDFSEGKKVSPFAVPMYMTSASASVISTYFNFKGTPFTVNTACASSLTAIIRACDILQLNRPGGPSMILAGGAEASLTDFVGASFLAAKAMSPDGISRPFDKNRNGFGPAEGAGVLVLERKSDALKRGARPLAEIIGFDEQHDHFDAESAPGVNFTSPDTSGEQLAESISTTLQQAQCSPDAIDVYNSHGTGTKFNDLTEARALKRVFGDKLPSVMALKGFMGHAGGASSVLELIGSILSMQGDYLPGNPQLEDLDPETGISLEKQTQTLSSQVHLKTAMGFGGTRAVIAIRKYSE
ncbi:beta-ketoacyl-[acyl-carrier-protein] synthase family protein [Ruficoccus sp. ZRK36]|uniref:beta-ketoacyl-[acyl-carrier-protein] synthase family protein n=1 Tax=Ruficoccus sp. ZRK36 TaxID=2866311 RepID=UPI001C72DB1D|nr:beta-ketoacyl-[acyl-carrier-protein] synthase family protein [Ruficoccus sp. ZRK36]